MERRGLMKLMGWMAVAGVPSVSRASKRERGCIGGFDTVADAALAVMRMHAETAKIGGVAMVAHFNGETIEAWSSKMMVVGRYKDEPSAKDKGNNLLAIVYAKASEMADTHKDSGSHVREPMTGEFGWSGGVFGKGKTGYLIAAFSGGKSEEDVLVSQAGMEELKRGL